jgi:orotidine-5'-phosphate decarboxylase
MNFNQKLDAIISKNNSMVCVGLDSTKPSQFRFNKNIIDQTHDLVAAYKPNLAFYEVQGEKGWHDLKLTMNYLREHHPDIVTIADAKRGDIGSTNLAYAKAVFDDLGFDAITLHPYLGQESLQPFLNRKDKGCIILCHTSNPGSSEFQDLPLRGETPKSLYQLVAQNVVNSWNQNENCLLVVAATYPKVIAEIRKIAPEMTFLVPGIGAGLNSQKSGLIINSSRKIIFAKNPRKETELLKDNINKYR